MFSYLRLEERVPEKHPLRAIRKLSDEVLHGMSEEFGKLYAATGRPSVAPERLLRALLLQVFYSIRSERMLMEQLDYNLLFRWFVGLEMDEEVWNHAVFSKNRDRLLTEEIVQTFFDEIKKRAAQWMSDEHFTVDGTLIEAWASHKSFQRKEGGDSSGGDAGRDFHGEKRSNDTHESKTDPEARLYKKSHGQEAKLAYLGHTMVENRNGMIASAMVTRATGCSRTYFSNPPAKSPISIIASSGRLKCARTASSEVDPVQPAICVRPMARATSTPRWMEAIQAAQEKG